MRRLILLAALLPAVAQATVYYVDTTGLNAVHATYQAASASTTGCSAACDPIDAYVSKFSVAYITTTYISGPITWAGTWSRGSAFTTGGVVLTLSRANNSGVAIAEICTLPVAIDGATSGTINSSCTATPTTMAVGERLLVTVDLPADLDTNGSATVTSVNVNAPESLTGGANNTGMMGFWGFLEHQVDRDRRHPFPWYKAVSYTIP